MEKNNYYKRIKTTLIILSIIIVGISLLGNILTSNEGSVTLLSFESFYVYIITISIALYKVFTNKKSNTMIFLSILTYLWTYFLVEQMITHITDIQINIELSFYLYLCSSIFLIVSLFFNNEKSETQITSIENQNKIKDINNNFIFTNFITGIKEIPLNTLVLLINNTPNNSLDLTYNIDNTNNKTINLPLTAIKNISYKSRVTMQETTKRVEEHETKSILLSAAVFGGNPLMQLLGNNGFNFIFNSLSNNYNKVNFNTYHEITIELVINNQKIKLILTSDNNPEEFIKLIPTNQNNRSII